MSTETVISADNLCKTYRIWESPSERIVGPLVGAVGRMVPGGLGRRFRARASAGFRDFQALQGLSFSVGKGEAIGIVGRNGSGKSTLLQILAGTLQATEGKSQVHGRVAALLELGAGFDPQFTGRENVYLNAAVLGLNRREIDERFAEIAAFADIGDFMEQPVMTYSSGMAVRLAFAVQTAVDPEVLIVDEALAVGDMFFQQKCFKRLRELRAKGTTLLLVSHDTRSVANLCSKALWLERGCMRRFGDAESVTRDYLTGGGIGAVGFNESGSIHSNEEYDLVMPDSPPLDVSGCDRLGNQEVLIEGVWLAGEYAGGAVPVGEWFEMLVLVHATRAMTDVSAGIEIRDHMGQVMAANGLRVKGLMLPEMLAGEKRMVRMRFQNLLAPGKYTIDVGCGNSSAARNAFDRLAGVTIMDSVLTDDDEPLHGFFRVPAKFEVGKAHQE